MITTVSAPEGGCWANTHKEAIEAVEVIVHLIAIERALAALAAPECPDADAR